ncbi:Hypothetical predicted protein [Podarcis lilfordi]|uniref:Uncharacterized protein n=1 Tax=Podarcis lilfordi TaxID=74358 RepID=A0AA35PNU3_9SAUR|nr:Hypothetical predicted protein [Podarcis lilfordi]
MKWHLKESCTDLTVGLLFMQVCLKSCSITSEPLSVKSMSLPGGDEKGASGPSSSEFQTWNFTTLVHYIACRLKMKQREQSTNFQRRGGNPF